jgi:hypothetical protein
VADLSIYMFIHSSNVKKDSLKNTVMNCNITLHHTFKLVDFFEECQNQIPLKTIVNSKEMKIESVEINKVISNEER